MKFIQFLFIIVFISACSGIKKEVVVKKELRMESENHSFTLYKSKKGFSVGKVIIPSDMDGCKVLIQVREGYLNPINLDSVFQINDLLISFKYKDAKPIANTCMTGKMVYVHEVEKYKD